MTVKRRVYNLPRVALTVFVVSDFVAFVGFIATGHPWAALWEAVWTMIAMAALVIILQVAFFVYVVTAAMVRWFRSLSRVVEVEVTPVDVVASAERILS